VSRPERVVLLAFFAGLLAVLASHEAAATAVGAAGGALAGVAVAGRVRRLRTRMDARLGVEPVARGLRLRALAVRAAVHLGVLGALLLSTAFVPFVGDELFAGAAAAVTALPAVLTAAGLRRRARRAGSAP
jgi:hypothetical protein